MIVYADTSALVKLFVTEKSSEATRAVMGQASALGTALLTRAELGSTFSRAFRGGYLSQEEATEARHGLDSVWPTWIHITVDERLVSLAEELAWRYGLRGYDAVHLASAQLWQGRVDRTVTLATFDQELWEAARLTGHGVWPS